jgi:hypothetical protein
VDGAAQLVTHGIVNGAARREHLGSQASPGEDALAPRQAIAHRHDDHVWTERRADTRRAAFGVLAQQANDRI